MSKDKVSQLKALVRTEPTLRATFESLEPEYQEANRHALSLGVRRDELVRDLGDIEEAKAELVKLAEQKPDAKPTPEKVEKQPATEKPPTRSIFKNKK